MCGKHRRTEEFSTRHRIGNTMYSVFLISSSITYSTFESEDYIPSLQNTCLSSAFQNFNAILECFKILHVHFDLTKLTNNKMYFETSIDIFTQFNVMHESAVENTIYFIVENLLYCV